MYVLVQLRNRLRVVPLSLSPLCGTQKKILQKKMAERHPGSKKHMTGMLFTLRISHGHLFLKGFFTVMFDSFSKRGATHSLA